MNKTNINHKNIFLKLCVKKLNYVVFFGATQISGHCRSQPTGELSSFWHAPGNFKAQVMPNESTNWWWRCSVSTHHNMFSEHSKKHPLQLLGINVLVQVCNLQYYWIITGYIAWHRSICSQLWWWNGMEVMLLEDNRQTFLSLSH